MTMSTEYTRWWRAVLGRDDSFDSVFVYGVRSTGVYCRPSCGARKPSEAQVAFFATTEGARAAGFRPCRRCQPDDAPGRELRAEMIRLSRFIEDYDSPDRPLTLAVMSDYMKISPSHLQRTFTRIMGVSPRKYAETMRLKQLKTLVRSGSLVTDALYEAGYGSSSRVYESSDRYLGMAPGVYRKGGLGMRIHYTTVDCLLGRLLVGATEKGISAVLIGGSDRELTAALREEYPSAVIVQDSSGLEGYIRALLDYLRDGRSVLDLPLDIRVTVFQARVYEELRKIGRGFVRTYSQIAEGIGRPGTARAVGNACAANPTALVIPCHRVVKMGGKLGGYRWGVERKKTLLAMERRLDPDESFEQGGGI
jgi:AraC family transcriptional regulator, regulatory protein of adaptative response / methylated-DNA-[protein]-cysteine methyltransferase